jgi:carbonic anhydrase
VGDSAPGDSIGNALPGRREALFLGSGALAGVLLGGCGAYVAGREPPSPQRDDAVTLTADQVRERLQAGNVRYRAGTPQYPDQDVNRRRALEKGQYPFAVILACADSRVSPEILFDQGLGDLFVVRTAGQVVDDVAMGSMQYAVEHLDVNLVVVLGHSSCGAVTATLGAVKSGKSTGTPIDSLVTGIRPAVEEARRRDVEGEELLDVAVRINVERGVARLKKAPAVGATRSHEVEVLGAHYDLGSGGVEWF